MALSTQIRIPDETKEEFSVTCHVDSSDELCLTRYTAQTKSKGKRNVLVLWTMRSLGDVTQDKGYCKPSLFYIFDTIRVNSKIIWCLKNCLDVNKTKSFDFAWKLAMQIMKPFITSWNINGMPIMKLALTERILDEKVQVTPQANGKRKQYLYPKKDKKRKCKQFEKEWEVKSAEMEGKLWLMQNDSLPSSLHFTL